MQLASDLYGLFRLATGLRTFARNPISLEESRALIRRGMQLREESFVRKVELAIFGNAKSPYLRLFRGAGCELGDVKRLAKSEGVEGALKILRDSGIYVTFNEFKGREPIRRGSDTFSVHDRDFDNKLITSHFRGATGGSSGKPSRIVVDLEHIAQTAPHHRIWFEDHGLMDRPLLLWSSGETSVANRHLLCTRYGMRFTKWFCSTKPSSVKDRLAATCVHALVRNAAGIPRYDMVPVDEPWRISQYLVQSRGKGQRPCLITTPSQAIQICLAASDKGHTLEDVTFLLGAEPLTTTRRATIEESGAKAVPTYGFSEGGNVGSQCRNAPVADDIHISLDAYAVIQRPRSVAGSEKVDALLLTALRPASPKVLFNTEIGDYAVMASHKCGCLFDEFDYHVHLHTIRSFDKLTGMGMTFIGADLFQIMEETLPLNFGGSAMDYQLVELQDDLGLPRYQLRVSPEVGQIDERLLLETFLNELGKQWSVYRWMIKIWRDTDVLQVQRERPATTPQGKVFPFRTLRE
jgi:hypothetical protein